MEYRSLEDGEIIKEGDQRDMCRDGWRDHAKWETVRSSEVGGKAPNPRFPSHRQYRRLLSEDAGK